MKKKRHRGPPSEFPDFFGKRTIFFDTKAVIVHLEYSRKRNSLRIWACAKEDEGLHDDLDFEVSASLLESRLGVVIARKEKV